MTPSEFLIRNEALFTPGNGKKGLDTQAGQGHNAIYLAKLGFQMETIVSNGEEAHALASLAEQNGIHLKILVADARRLHFAKEKYDLILYLHEIDRNLALQLKRALKPGGMMVVERGGGKGLQLLSKEEC